MKTINIKGKEYVQVVERVKEFHIQFPKGWIETEVLQLGDDLGRVSIKAIVYIGDGRNFSGHSQAVYGKGMMGDVALEVAETSAVGRALGFANIGLIDGITSADELKKAGGAPRASQGMSKEDSDEKRLLATYQNPKSEAQKKWAKAQLVILGHDFDDLEPDHHNQQTHG